MKSEKVLVSYTQEFWGEKLTDQYIREIKDEEDIRKIYTDLYSDPHVKSVVVKRLEADQ